MTNNQELKKCGFVAIMGASNAGKSTLINKMTGENISIISPKVQTTRTKVLGIVTKEDHQIILIDTPGIFKPRRRLDRAMLSAAWQGMMDADIIVLLVDANINKINSDTIAIIDRIKKIQESGDKRPVWLALNKIDLINPETLLDLSKELNEMLDFEKTFMISALKNKAVNALEKALAKSLPESDFIFSEDEITDMPMKLIAAEMTREQIFLQLHKELPYAITVETEQWERFDNGSVKISQVIYVERDSQKAIILGKGGSKIKSLGERSRLNLEKFMECRIHLKLFVKVKENWSDDPERYMAWGLDPSA